MTGNPFAWVGYVRLANVLEWTNGRRRTRLLDQGDILRAIRFASRRGHHFDHGGGVANAYTWRAYTTKVLAVREGSEIVVSIHCGDARSLGAGEGDLESPVGRARLLDWAKSGQDPYYTVRVPALPYPSALAALGAALEWFMLARRIIDSNVESLPDCVPENVRYLMLLPGFGPTTVRGILEAGPAGKALEARVRLGASASSIRRAARRLREGDG